MGQLANIDYFWKKTNQQLGTSYSDTSKQVINIEWLVKAVQNVYRDIHTPKSGCRLLLSTTFNDNLEKLVVDVNLVNAVTTYLKQFNRICDADCACPCVNNTSMDTCSIGNCYIATCNTCMPSTCSPCIPTNCNTCSTCLPCIMS